NCSGGGNPSDVVVEVIGVAPFNYSIISPITIDNGANNIFSGLPNGTYEIKVEDACGSIENITVNLENLLPLVRANTPDDFTICKDDGVEQEVFQLDTQNEQILGNQNPNNYTITYHLSQSDADSGNNPLPNQFTNNTNPQTVYARVVHNNLMLCHATTSFQIYVGQVPVFSEEETVYICPDGTAMLTADSGFDAYLWSTEETTQSITVDQAGTYTVTIIDEIGDFYCENTKNYQVVNSDPPTIESIEISDWTANDNTIAVMVSGYGNYVYSLDGINYQTQNTFFNLQPGEYIVYVKDNNGCGIIDKDVYLLNYPKFFTPNGDDVNEFWQIKFASLEPDLKVFIFDRYGKLLKQFGSQDAGWDGTYNGNTMPTNDYWFVVTRANGLTYKGHFTLKR
ncbi:MAG: T9SS type B sorting domain-containing protein, partial [Flavobacteriaceae bacterium]|nr:T9SS type B sorting domain-containing protein [Flavobacteriaceae bacterium]